MVDRRAAAATRVAAWAGLRGQRGADLGACELMAACVAAGA
ncbi:MAG TPA: hypothetical protein VM677_14890 [Actinokineospora sp.]|nr:hypothetical protein [Actinokineospora sp.]